MAQLSKFEIEMFAKRAAAEFVGQGRDLNEAIFEIAGVNDLSREQVKRVVEAANTIANGELVKRAKATGSDPRVSFKLASSTEVFSKIIGASPEAKEAQERQTEKLAGMFTVTETKPAIDIEKLASAPEPKLSHMTGVELAGAYLGSLDLSNQAFTVGQISDAVAEICRIQEAANTKLAWLMDVEETLATNLSQAVQDELHAGVSPATVKAAMAQMPVCDWHLTKAQGIVDSKAEEMAVDEGVSKLAGAIVDTRSDVLVGTCALLLLDVERDAVFKATDKVAEAKARAESDLAKAYAAGSAKLAFGLSSIAHKGGKVMGAVGVGLGAMEAKNRAQQATVRLKKTQMTPAVGPMKIAAQQMGFGFGGGSGSGFMGTLRSLKPTPGQLAAIALASGVAAVGHVGATRLVDAASSAVGGVFERRQRDKLFEKLLARDPGLKREARAREYFDLVLTYAPALGDHPTAIGDFLKRQLQYPVSGVEFLGALAKLQKDVSESRRKGNDAFSSGVGGAIQGAQVQWIKGVG